MIVTKNRTVTGAAALLALLVIITWVVTSDKASGIHRQDEAPAAVQKAGDAAASAAQKEKKIKYWVAPMDPTYIRNKPGKSPMGMDLVPVYEDDSGASADGTVSIDPVTVQSMGVRTTKVTRGPLKTSLRTVGHITYNEERVEHIHTKVSGWVEQLFVKTTGQYIEKGQKILSIYSPELVATQQEYLQALSYKEKVIGSSFPDIISGADTLLESTKKRLLLMDISPEQIEALEQSGQAQRDMVLRSPESGIVIEKKVFEGMKVNPGMELYTIADLSRVWVLASVYEYELPFISVGQETSMTLPYESGTAYHGKVTFIYPYLSPKTRTVQVRMEFDNPDLKLKPDMYADVVITTKISKDVLQVPSETVLKTGYRNIVITSIGNGKFLPKVVEVGPEGEGMTEILSGLSEGETVVTSGQFLIDSESNLKEAIHKMLETQQAESPSDTQDNVSTGESDEKNALQHVHLSDDQQRLLNQLINNYLDIHAALITESVSEVSLNAQSLEDTLHKISALNHEGYMQKDVESMEDSIQGLLSGDLQTARGAFKTLSRAMVNLVRGPAREQAVSAGIRVYFCPMEEERWLQKGTDLKNPYLGKEMWICGTEEKL